MMNHKSVMNHKISYDIKQMEGTFFLLSTSHSNKPDTGV